MLTHMMKNGGLFEISATALVGYLNCRHLSELDRAVAEGTVPKPTVWDPLLQILSERGAAREQNYVEHLTRSSVRAI
jgi:hypothetical protein